MEHYFTNNEDLEHNIKKINISINGINYFYYTDNGVFSKDNLDTGSKILLETFEDNKNIKKILDIGCGCGPIGIYLCKKNYDVDMCDINNRALILAKRALDEQGLKANVLNSDAYCNIKSKYDCIISNPPIRVGKSKLYEIVIDAKEHLNENGFILIVIRKDKGAKSLLKDLEKKYSKANVINIKKGYYIIKAIV